MTPSTLNCAQQETKRYKPFYYDGQARMTNGWNRWINIFQCKTSPVQLYNFVVVNISYLNFNDDVNLNLKTNSNN